MSEAIAFDTHRFVKNLTASGFTERQAEALAVEQIRLLNANLATKTDLAEVKADLEVKIETVRSDLATVKADLEVKIETVRSDLEVKIETVRSDLEVKIETVRSDLATVKADLEVKIEKVKSDLLIWMIGALTAHVAVIAALIRFLA